MDNPFNIPEAKKKEEGQEEIKKEENGVQEQEQKSQDVEKQPEGNEQKAEENEQKQEQEQEKVLKDEDVLTYLKDKGVEINSFEDLKKDPFANEEVKKLNQFVSETNRNIDDYIKATEDISAIPEEDLVKRYLTESGETVDSEDAELTLEDEYKPLPIPEDAEDTEVNRIKRQNKKREKKLQKLKNEAKQHFESLQEKWKAPKESFDEKMNQTQSKVNAEFKENAQKALESMESLNLETIDYKIDRDKYKNKFGSYDSLMEAFKTENGEFDYTKLVSTLVAGFEAKNIAEAAANKSKNETLDQSLKEKRNVDGVNAESREGGDDPYKQMAEEMKKKFRL